tara:strand:+ start:265 stop:393 length:129 start_codon:yes stop_codon:yes gene_type:complete
MSDQSITNLSIDQKHQEIINNFDLNDKSLQKIKKKKKTLKKN